MGSLNRSSTLAAITFALLSVVIGQSASADNVVIVNINNSYTANEDTMRKVVKRLFLKQQSTWPDGTNAKSFDRRKASAEQQAFNSTVLGMDDAVIARHWLSLKQTTGETPPRTVGSTNMLAKFVAKYDGAFGVVAESELGSLSDRVRVLFKF